MKILIDSRKQLPYAFPGYEVEIEIANLPAGDYSLPGFEDRAAIERKTLNDLVGCLMGKDRERFERELARSRHYDLFCVVVEASLADVANRKYRSDMKPHAALQEWYHVSKGLLQDFKKYGERGREVLPTLKLGTLSGAGYLAGGAPGVVVANGFALLSALGTMGKGNLGFIRNYLLKEGAPFGTSLAKQAAEFGGVEGLQRPNQSGQTKPSGGRWVPDEPGAKGQWVLDEGQ